MKKGERHPIVYLSKKLLPQEQHYAAIEKECLAMVWALKKLEPYLFGRHFTVYTDHSPLTWLHQMKGANAKLLRWSLLLQDYDMDVVHVKGSANLIADALSRRGGPELPQVTGQSDPAQLQALRSPIPSETPLPHSQVNTPHPCCVTPCHYRAAE
ncbi:unnamed protein product [Lepidochelys olivacea]